MKLVIGIIIGAILFIPATVVATSIWRDTTLNADYENNGSIQRFDDNRFQVKCWRLIAGYAGGISCIPWSEAKER